MFARSFSVLVAGILAISLNATHIVGGELYYDHLGGDQYQVTLKLYRDCDPNTNVNGTGYDALAVIGVFSGDGTFLFTQSLTFPGAQSVPIVLDSPCLTLPPSLCVESALYTGVLTLPLTPDGYQLSYQRCCRTPAIINIINANDVGLTCTVRVPGQTVVASNSSPRFNQLPPVALCLGQPLSFDHSATDPDGDVLEYSLCTPFTGADPLNPIPAQPTAPPYTPIPWLAPTYSEGYPIDSDPAIAIDVNTGQLTLTPSVQGSFVVGVMVREYRDGVLLTESRRDFMFKVVACDATVNAAITPPQLCTGLTMNFGNSSGGGQTWFWDFGVPGVDNDTAIVATPSWTYVDQGVYTITLIANPNTVCADTVEASFEVFIAPEPFFTPPTAMCGPQTVTLVAEGAFSIDANLQWDLGAGATPASATGGEVVADFTATGVHTVSLTATDNGCTVTYTADVLVYPQPEPFFTPPPAMCGSEPVTLVAEGAFSADANFQWDFGAGATPPSGTGGQVVAEFTPTGAHTVLLTVTDNGCTATYTADVTVYPQPEVLFITPPVMCGSEPVTLVAEGTFSAEADLQWDLGAGGNPPTATGGQVVAEFTATGVHTVSLTATDNGCTATYTADVTVYPQPDALFTAFPLDPQLVGVPVAFTDATTTHGGTIATWAWTINGVPAGGSSSILDWTSTWPGDYEVVLTVTTTDGCTDTYSMIYTVEGGPITIPNVFTPNGDDENEAFHIVNVDHYNNQLRIYSRWGNVVYEATNYKNDWRGGDLSEGTYYYVLHITDDREYAGHVTLLR